MNRNQSRVELPGMDTAPSIPLCTRLILPDATASRSFASDPDFTPHLTRPISRNARNGDFGSLAVVSSRANNQTSSMHLRQPEQIHCGTERFADGMWDVHILRSSNWHADEPAGHSRFPGHFGNGVELIDERLAEHRVAVKKTQP